MDGSASGSDIWQLCGTTHLTPVTMHSSGLKGANHMKAWYMNSCFQQVHVMSCSAGSPSFQKQRSAPSTKTSKVTTRLNPQNIPKHPTTPHQGAVFLSSRISGSCLARSDTTPATMEAVKNILVQRLASRPSPGLLAKLVSFTHLSLGFEVIEWYLGGVLKSYNQLKTE